MRTTRLSFSWGQLLSPRYYLVYVVGLIGIYFVFKEAWPYSTFTEEQYRQYWPAKFWLGGHLLGGGMALLLGPSQFISEIRNRNLRLHRWMGKAYILSILFGSASAMVMCFTVSPRVNFAWSASLFFLALPWMLSVLMAYRMIRLKRIRQHQEWMIRSYVITFGFVLFRIIENAAIVEGWMPDFGERGPTVGWFCWAVPLFFAEMALQWNKER